MKRPLGRDFAKLADEDLRDDEGYTPRTETFIDLYTALKNMGPYLEASGESIASYGAVRARLKRYAGTLTALERTIIAPEDDPRRRSVSKKQMITEIEHLNEDVFDLESNIRDVENPDAKQYLYNILEMTAKISQSIYDEAKGAIEVKENENRVEGMQIVKSDASLQSTTQNHVAETQTIVAEKPIATQATQEVIYTTIANETNTLSGLGFAIDGSPTL